jgi:hypothetical protein
MQLVRDSVGNLRVDGGEIGRKKTGGLDSCSEGKRKIGQGTPLAHEKPGGGRNARSRHPALTYHISGADVSRLPNLASAILTSAAYQCTTNNLVAQRIRKAQSFIKITCPRHIIQVISYSEVPAITHFQ